MSTNNERINQIMASELQTGAKVMTADDQEIGTVSAIEGEYFKVDAPMQRDYWLSLEYAYAAGDGRVSVSFRKQDVGVYKLSGPGLGDTETTSAGIVFSEEEQRAQRMEMLRDVVEKHEELAPTAPEAERRIGEAPEAELQAMESGGPDALDRELRQHGATESAGEAPRNAVAAKPSTPEPEGAGPAEGTPVEGLDSVQKEIQARQSQP